MSRTRIVKGTYTKITGGDHSMYAKGNIVTTAGKSINEIGKEKGITYNMPKSPPKKQSATRVKEIELITPLDLGSKNDGKGKTQEGFIFGKTYKFKVKSFTNGNPVSNQLIRWMYKYHNLTTNKWVEVHSKIKGDQYSLYFNEKEMCGRFVFVRAYIDDEDNEGKLQKWHHNRFRWFDRSIIEDEIKERTDNKKPWLVNQSGTSLCGMACIFYLFAKEQPNEYKKFAKTLFRTGEATFNKYIVKPSEELFEINPKNSNFPKTSGIKMPLVDYITLAGTRNADNPDYKGGNEEFEAINWPWLMTNLGKKLLGYNTVEMDYYKVNKSYLRDFFGSDEKIRILEKGIDVDYKNGYQICLLIDGSMVAYSAESNYSLDDFQEYHWITYEGGLQILNGTKVESDYDNVTNINFNVVTWGELRNGSLGPKIKLTKNQFRSNYYGYIRFK